MRQKFQNELVNTLYIHKPLAVHRESELEAEAGMKEVQRKKVIWDGESKDYTPEMTGTGVMSVDYESRVIRLEAPSRTDKWPKGAPEDGDYSAFGITGVRFVFQNEDWRRYNRLHFRWKPMVDGGRIIYGRTAVENVGEVRVPDKYLREGHTTFDLKNYEWNECYWEFPSMGRDSVRELKIYFDISGQDIPQDDVIRYELSDIRIETIAEPELEKGWECRKNKIVFSTQGYFVKGKKTALANVSADTFSVFNSETNEKVFDGDIQCVVNENGSFQVLDFTELKKEGRYYLQAEGIKSESFEISSVLLEEPVWKIINFLYCQRCGMPIAKRHGTCHEDIYAEHNGVIISYSGGWHDAGDLSQQTLQTGEIVHALLETAEQYKDNRVLYERLLEEAQWGLDFILKTRFGDGYRATSAPCVRVTNNKLGDMDDIKARVHNHSFENFTFAGIEAYAAYVLKEEDPAYAFGCLKAAREDFAFAEEKFAETKVDPFFLYEHTFNCGLSQYYAAIVWAASNLYMASGEEEYAKKARQWGDMLLKCQEEGGSSVPLRGFFYRDESHKSIVHFNHQSREQQFIQALELLCRTQHDSPDRLKWEEGLRGYGEYLKAIAPYTAPYGMIPAGIHHFDETEDEELFPYMHLLADYHEQKEDYKKQLESGVPLGNGYAIRKFPVWFSFRGNNAVLLSMGKAASLIGKYFKDDTLIQIAKEQLYWIWGKNPFGQSMQYGAGTRYCRQFAALCGESTGEIPVGIETYENEDVPYWPQNNNATYKEIWTTSAGRWLWVAADIEETERL